VCLPPLDVLPAVLAYDCGDVLPVPVADACSLDLVCQRWPAPAASIWRTAPAASTWRHVPVAAVGLLLTAAVNALRTLEHGRRFVNPEEIGTHLDLAKIERDLRAALAAVGHPAATTPARSPLAGVGQPKI